MNKFKVGDKVKCIDVSGMYDELQKGKIYSVNGVHNQYISITNNKGDKNFMFLSDRFELVEEEKVEEKVEEKLPHELLGLPKYYVVKKNESDPLWAHFYLRFNSFYSVKYSKGWLFYGVDGTLKGGTNAHGELKSFHNNPTLITLEERDRCVNKRNEEKTEEKKKLKPISQTYSIDGFTFIISDNGISIPGKGDERLLFKNSKKSVVKKFRQALDKFCDEMGI